MTRSTIRYGSRGTDVKVWQRILGVNDDGLFGRQTEAATKKWQSEHGLVADGIVGTRSWAAASSVAQVQSNPPKAPSIVKVGNTATKTETVRYGSRGPAVVAVQQILGVSPTGIFDSKTRSAVTSFQKSRGLKADGIVGVNTWRALREFPPTVSAAAVPRPAKTTSTSSAQKALIPTSATKNTVSKNTVDESSKNLQAALKAGKPISEVRRLEAEAAAKKAAAEAKAAAARAAKAANVPKIAVSLPAGSIKQGSKGKLVQEWQEIIGATVDGVFGPKTTAMTKAWQQTHGLIADGVVGPLTWAKAHSLAKQGVSLSVGTASMIPNAGKIHEVVENIKDHVAIWPTWKKVGAGLLLVGAAALGLRK